MTTATVEPLAVGYGLRGLDDFMRCPIGTVIKHPIATYTKMDELMWRQHDNGYMRDPNHYFSKYGENKIVSLPIVFRVGDELKVKPRDFAAMPVGTVVRCHTSRNRNRTLTKEAENKWRGVDYARLKSDDWFNLDHRHTIESLPMGTTEVVLNQNPERQAGMSTAIREMEALRSIEQGRAISVGTDRWERVEEGFRKDGVTLAPDHFEWDMKQGFIVLGERIAPEQVWHEGAYHYVVCAKDQARAGHWKCARFYNQTFHDMASYETVPGTLLPEKPEWANHAYRMGAQMNTYMEQAVANEKARAEVSTRADQLTAQQSHLRALLSKLAREHEDVSRETISEFLTEHGMTPLPSEVTVSCVGRVAEFVGNIKPEALKKAATLDPTTDVRLQTRVTVTYDFEFEVVVEAEAGTCACSQVARSKVRNYLQAKGVEYSGYDLVSRICPNGH